MQRSIPNDLQKPTHPSGESAKRPRSVKTPHHHHHSDFAIKPPFTFTGVLLRPKPYQSLTARLDNYVQALAKQMMSSDSPRSLDPVRRPTLEEQGDAECILACSSVYQDIMAKPLKPFAQRYARTTHVVPTTKPRTVGEHPTPSAPADISERKEWVNLNGSAVVSKRQAYDRGDLPGASNAEVQLFNVLDRYIATEEKRKAVSTSAKALTVILIHGNGSPRRI